MHGLMTSLYGEPEANLKTVALRTLGLRNVTNWKQLMPCVMGSCFRVQVDWNIL